MPPHNLVIDSISALHRDVDLYWEKQANDYIKSSHKILTRFDRTVEQKKYKRVRVGDQLVEKSKALFHDGIGVKVRLFF